MKIAILGFGKMGEAIAGGLRKSLGTTIEFRATVASSVSAEKKSAKWGFPVQTAEKNSELAAWADVLILGVKPWLAEKSLREIQNQLNSSKILLSVCASVSLTNLEQWTQKSCEYIRVMPNLPSLVGAGMSLYSLPAHFPQEKIPLVENILGSLGRSALIDEKNMDAATAISGCGPAFFFMIIESICDAGVKLGLTRKLAIELACQTMMGSAKMILDTGAHPEALKDEVTTPGGITIDGVVALEDGHMRSTMMKAIFAAARRSAELKK